MSDVGANPFVIETTSETFESDVIERSHRQLVVLDFYATWCAPCRMLSPVLEQLAAEGAGEFVLVKADSDHLPDYAAAFQIRSLPTVLAFRDGRVIDAFQGALPEPSVRAWLERIVPRPGQRLSQEALTLEAEDPERAETIHRQALALEPDDLNVVTRAAGFFLTRGHTEECRNLVKEMRSRGFQGHALDAIEARLDLQAHSGDLSQAEAEARDHPDDPEARRRLALALAASGQHRRALDILLECVERDRGEERDAARRHMVELFQALGDEDTLTQEYRRKLSSALF